MSTLEHWGVAGAGSASWSTIRVGARCVLNGNTLVARVAERTAHLRVGGGPHRAGTGRAKVTLEASRAGRLKGASDATHLHRLDRRRRPPARRGSAAAAPGPGARGDPVPDQHTRLLDRRVLPAGTMRAGSPETGAFFSVTDRCATRRPTGSSTTRLVTPISPTNRCRASARWCWPATTPGGP